MYQPYDSYSVVTARVQPIALVLWMTHVEADGPAGVLLSVSKTTGNALAGFGDFPAMPGHLRTV